MFYFFFLLQFLVLLFLTTVFMQYLHTVFVASAMSERTIGGLGNVNNLGFSSGDLNALVYVILLV